MSYFEDIPALYFYVHLRNGSLKIEHMTLGSKICA